RRAAAIGPAWRTTGGQVHRLAAISEVESVLEIREESPGVVAFDLCYSSDRLGLLRQSYRLDASGVAITATWLSAPPEMHQWWLEVPVLQSNGRDQAAHRSGTGGLDVMLAGHRYRIRSDQTPVLGSEVLGNRNGTYRLARVRADGDVLSIHLSLGS